MPWLMQARDSSSGELVTWLVEDGPDFDASDYPGPGNAQHVAVSMVFGEGGGGGGALPGLGTETLLGRDQGDVGEITLGDGLEFTGDNEIQVADGGVALTKLENAEQYRVLGRVDSGAGSPTYLTPAQLGSVVARAGNISMADGNIMVSGDWTGSMGSPGMSTSLSAQRRIRDTSVPDSESVALTCSMFSGGAGFEEYAVELIVVNSARTQLEYHKSVRCTLLRGADGTRGSLVVKPIDDDYFDASGHELEIELSDNNLVATYTNSSGNTVRATIYSHGTSLNV